MALGVPILKHFRVCNGSASYKFENVVDSVNDISEFLS